MCLWIMEFQSYVLVFNVSTLYQSNSTMKSLQVLNVHGGYFVGFPLGILLSRGLGKGISMLKEVVLESHSWKLLGQKHRRCASRFFCSNPPSLL